MIILDTNVISELLRTAPEQRVVDWLGARDGAHVYLTAITEAERRPDGASEAVLSQEPWQAPGR